MIRPYGCALDLENKRLNRQAIENLLSFIAVLWGHQLTSITRHIDRSFSATELSRWMDTVDGRTGGWYHRVKHGHDPLANMGEVYDKFGVEGVLKYPFELLKDVITPHGIPFPGTQFLVQNGYVSAKTATEWLSMNIGHMFAAGVSVYFTHKLWKKSKAGDIDESTVTWAVLGAGVKVAGGVVTKNPVLIISGVVDGVLVLDIKRAECGLGRFQDTAFSDETLGYLTVAGGMLAAGIALRSFGILPSLIAATAGYVLYCYMKKRRTQKPFGLLHEAEFTDFMNDGGRKYSKSFRTLVQGQDKV